MSHCTNPQLSEKLFAFELGMLSDIESAEVEAHIYECEACFESAKKFLPAAGLLRHDPEVKDLAGTEIDITREEDEGSKGSLVGGSLRKYLLAALLVLAAAYPAYWLAFESGSTYQVAQVLTLTPMRSSGNNLVSLEMAGEVSIEFVVEEYKPGAEFNLLLTSMGGDTLFSDISYDDFTADGLGAFSLPVGLFRQDSYLLTISDPSGRFIEYPLQYTFRAE